MFTFYWAPKSEDGCAKSMDMEIEVEGEDGSKFALGNGDKAVFGRGSGFNTRDRSVSRQHVSFQFDYSEPELPRVSFEVTGKNPIWVWTHNALNLFRKFDKGHLQFGDRFCLSVNTPLWFVLKKNEPLSQINLDEFDVSQFDPVKEFGFLVMGHEFDQFPKGMIRNVKDWEWFLEEPRKHNEDEEDFEKDRKKMRGKRKTCEDEEWSGENEDDKDLVANIRKGKLPGYSTRSRDCKGPNRDTKSSKNSKPKKASSVDEIDEEDDGDDDDEMLGGFIVADEDDHVEENDEEEEEEFEEDDDDEEGMED